MSLLVNLMNHGHYFRQHPAMSNGVHVLEHSTDQEHWEILPIHPEAKHTAHFGFDTHQVYLEYYKPDEEGLCQLDYGYSTMTRDLLRAHCRNLGLLEFGIAAFAAGEEPQLLPNAVQIDPQADTYVTALRDGKYQIDSYDYDVTNTASVRTFVFDHMPGQRHIALAHALLDIDNMARSLGEIIVCQQCGRVLHWSETDGRVLVQCRALEAQLCGQCYRNANVELYGEDPEPEDYGDIPLQRNHGIEGQEMGDVTTDADPVLLTTAGAINPEATRAYIQAAQSAYERGENDLTMESIELTRNCIKIVVGDTLKNVPRSEMEDVLRIISAADGVRFHGHSFAIDEFAEMWGMSHPDETPLTVPRMSTDSKIKPM